MLIKGKYIKPSTIKRERVYKEHKEYLMDNDYMKLPEERKEIEILKRPEEYSWEYKKFRKLSKEPKDIYKN